MFKGVTFDNQNVTSKIDGSFYNRLFGNDGIIHGCSMSATAKTLTIQPGVMIVAGRLIRVDSATTLTFANMTNAGYGQVVLTIDLSQQATASQFDQVSVSFAYSATTTFPALTKGKINADGNDMIYQTELAVVQIASSSITQIVRTMVQTYPSAGYLDGHRGSYYEGLAEAAQTTASNAIPKTDYQGIAAKGFENDANSISDGITYCIYNIPDGLGYAFVLQCSSNQNSKVQIAMPFTGGTGLKAAVSCRWYYTGVGWSPWQEAIPRSDYQNIGVKGTENNANSIDDGFYYCTSNIPSGLSYAFILQCSVSNNTRVQLALPFSGSSSGSYPLAWRWYYMDGGWSPWQRSSTAELTANAQATANAAQAAAAAAQTTASNAIPKTDYQGIAARGFANDANNISDGFSYCTANIPAGLSYSFVLQCSANSNSRVQLAMPFSGASGSRLPLHWRWYYTEGGWSSWQEAIISTDYKNIGIKGQKNKANSISDGFYYCDENLPGGMDYAFVLQCSLSENTKVQLALPFSGSASGSYPIAWRWYYTGAGWSGWLKAATDAQAAAAAAAANAAQSTANNAIPKTDYQNIGTKGQTNNANAISDGFYYCTQNIPSGLSYAFILQCSLSENTKVQLALPFQGYARTNLSLHWRWYYKDTGWSSWDKAADIPADGAAAWNAVSLSIMNGSAGTPITAGAYTTVSTRRSKTAIKDLDLDRAKKILDLNPVEYEIKGDDEHKKHYGMIAEDVDKIDAVPVTRVDDKIVGLDYQSFIAPLIKLAQEQEKRIIALEEKISALTSANM